MLAPLRPPIPIDLAQLEAKILGEKAVTVCKPGRRVGLTPRIQPASSFPITTVVAIREADRIVAPSAKGDRRTAQARLQALEEARAMSVALAARSRHGCSEALGRFVDEQRLRGELYQAGAQYAELVRDARIALGLHVAGQPQGPGAESNLDAAQLAARKEFALMARDSADRVLLNRDRISAMIRLTSDEIYPPRSETRMLRQGLFALARHFGLLKVGINEGRSA
jgi:hypothetical protein